MGALLVSLLVASVLVIAGDTADAAPVDCAETSWVVATTAELGDAVACWNASTEPGLYSITLAADVDAPDTIQVLGPDRELVVDGQGYSINGRVTVARIPFDPEAVTGSSFVFRDLTLRGANDVGIVFGETAQVLLEDAVIIDSPRGVSSEADLVMRRVLVSGLTDDDTAAVSLGGRTLIEDSAIVDGQNIGVEVDGGFSGPAALIMRNSVVQGNNLGLFVRARAEVVITESLIADNEREFIRVGGIQTSGSLIGGASVGPMVTVINSTVTGHENPTMIDPGRWAPENSLGVGHTFDAGRVVVTNSTIVGQRWDLAGPVHASSSLLESCDLQRPGPFGPPVDGGANAGGCFGGDATLVLPLRDNGCAVPTPVGCVPTMKITTGSPGAGTGACSNVPVLDTVADLFAWDAGQVDWANPEPLLTAMGTQTIDQRGFARSTCDAGAYAINGEVTPPAAEIRVLSWNVERNLCYLDGGACGAAVGQNPRINVAVDMIVNNQADVVAIQNTTRQPYIWEPTSEELNQLDRDLQDRGYSMLYRFVPRGPETESGNVRYWVGQAVFTRWPVVSQTSIELPAVDPPDGKPPVIQAVVILVNDEPIRIVNTHALTDGTACDQVEALIDWLDAQPELTTVITASFEVDAATDCRAELASRWIDGCNVVALPDCGDPGNEAILHLPASSSSVLLTSTAAVGTAATQSVSSRPPILATFSLFGGGSPDVDGDGVADAIDNCPSIANADQADRELDQIGDSCDPVLDGDGNCDDSRDIIDALLIAQWSVGIRADGGACPLADPLTQLNAHGSDVNGDRVADIVDALLIARCAAGNFNDACPDPG